jgi:hypothetical protein
MDRTHFDLYNQQVEQTKSEVEQISEYFFSSSRNIFPLTFLAQNIYITIQRSKQRLQVQCNVFEKINNKSFEEMLNFYISKIEQTKLNVEPISDLLFGDLKEKSDLSSQTKFIYEQLQQFRKKLLRQ